MGGSRKALGKKIQLDAMPSFSPGWKSTILQLSNEVLFALELSREVCNNED